MIISVPHSGTRSLRVYLDESGFWHWGLNDPDIEQYVGHVDVPVRDPFELAISWETRYQDDQNMQSDEMIRRIEMMLDYEDWHKSREGITVEYWRTDSIPVHTGVGKAHWAKSEENRSRALKLDRVVSLVDWYRGNDRAQAFYKRLYPEGFWWA